MSKKKTRKRNYNKYSRKRVSRKRVSKRFSRKRKGMRGGMDRIRSILGSVGDWLETASPEDIQRYQEWVQEKTGGPDEILEPQQLLGASEPELDPALEPEQVADFGGIAGGPKRGDDLKFVLIPGSDNSWGTHRLTPKEKEEGRVTNPTPGRKVKPQLYNPGHWQTRIAELITDDNILKTTTDYNKQGGLLHCGDRHNKPFNSLWVTGDSPAIEMRNCIQSIFETYPETPKSVISTSQGSAILIDILADNPKMLNNIVSIVFVSPATIFPGGAKWSGEDGAYQKLNNFLKACEDRHISILLLLTEYHWARWNGNHCVDANEEEAVLVSDCHVIKNSSACKSIFIPNTTHSFDICNGCPHWPPFPDPRTQPNANNLPLPQAFLESIVKWCINPNDFMIEEMVRTSGGAIV